GRPWAVGAIATSSYGEVLISSVEPKRLQLHGLDSGGELLHDELVDHPRGFYYRFLVPMTDADTVAGIGYFPEEGRDSLVLISLHRLLAEPGYLADAVHRLPLLDDAYKLAAGPCGPAAAVFYRDPEDDEDAEDEGEEIEDHDRYDVYGIHGLYIRRLDDPSVVEAIPIDVTVPAGASLAGSERHIVAAVEDGALVALRSGEAATLVPAHRVALDPCGNRCVLAGADGEIRLLSLT